MTSASQISGEKPRSETPAAPTSTGKTHEWLLGAQTRGAPTVASRSSEPTRGVTTLAITTNGIGKVSVKTSGFAGLAAIIIATTSCITINQGDRAAGNNSGTANTSPSGSEVSHTPSSEPSGDKGLDSILARYVSFLGGEEAARSVSTISAKGTFEMPEQHVSGSAEEYGKAPNKSASVLRSPDDRIFTIQAFDGTSGWEKTLRKDAGRIEVRDIRGDELELLKLNSDFYREYHLQTLYPRMELKGTEPVDKRNANVIDATPASGKKETLYFDAQSGELIRRDLALQTPQGEANVQVYYDNYREVSGANGMKMPYTQSLFFPDTPSGNVIVRFSEIKANQALLDKTFERPEK